MLALMGSFTSVLGTIGRVLLAFVILMLMVLIHETGHYAAGKMLKFKINEFSVGMGPKLFSKTKKNGEVFSLRLLPLGGFCAFEGENEDNPSPQAFNSQKPWKRLIVLFSGAFFNFISALIVCVILFGCYGETVAKVNTVYDYAPTFNQQLEEGDIIYKINGKRVFVLDSLSRYMKDEMSVTVIKPNGEVQTYDGVKRETFCSTVVSALTGEYKSEDGIVLTEGQMIYKLDGVSLHEKGAYWDYLRTKSNDDICTVTVVSKGGYHDLQISVFDLKNKISVEESTYTGMGMAVEYATYRFGFGEALLRVFPYCGEVAMLVLRTLGGLFTGAVGLSQVGGPISTITMTSQVVAYGFPSVLSLIVLISVNLAVFNLLPVPALDGCQMLFVLIEWIAKKPINRKVLAWINGVGLVLIIGFAILVDLLKL